MSRRPLVSALICAHNAERFIEQTLCSVLRQSYRNIEILILDNASRDDTYAKLMRLASESAMSMRVMRSETNLGVPAGLNKLLDAANGKYAAILDHDDFWHREKTKLQVDFLEARPEYPACGSQTYVWWEKTGQVCLFKANEYDSFTYHLTLMFRTRPDWRYDPGLPYRPDAHFTHDVLCAAGRRIYNFQQPLGVWRMRADGQNLSRNWNSVKILWPYWRRTGNHLEAVKGLIGRALPRRAFDAVLRARHSILELHAGAPALEGFPAPVGPITPGCYDQV